jgi:hypothetical protein
MPEEQPVDAETRISHSHSLILRFSSSIQNIEIRKSKSVIILIVTLFKILYEQKHMLETLT